MPYLIALAPSARYYTDKGRRPKHLTDWARQMICQLRRWLPQHDLVVVGDAGYAVLDLLHACRQLARPVTLVTRLRLDAALYEPAPPYGGCGRPRKKGKRLPTLRALLTAEATAWCKLNIAWYQGTMRTMEITSDTAVWYHTGKPPVPMHWVLLRDPQGVYDPVALLSTDPNARPEQIATWFVRRWAIEVTLEETRRHPGVETQRQWSDLAILRSTPALLGLFSWVTLLAHHLHQTQALPVQRTAWYAKPRPTLAYVCRCAGVGQTTAVVLASAFLHVALASRYRNSPPAILGPSSERTLLSSLTVQSRAKKVALVAAARKLLNWAWTIFSRQSCWNAEFHPDPA